MLITTLPIVYQLFTELSTATITAMKLLFLRTLLESN